MYIKEYIESVLICNAQAVMDAAEAFTGCCDTINVAGNAEERKVRAFRAHRMLSHHIHQPVPEAVDNPRHSRYE